jgi:hypothetical protein
MNMFEQYVEHISALGALGVVGDILSIDKASDLTNAVSFAVKPVIIADIEKVADAYTKYMLDYENYGDAFLATKRNMYQIPSLFGSLPKAASKNLLTKQQQENRASYFKTQTKNEILELLLQGKHQRAKNLTVQWNKKNPRTPITYNDVNSSALRKYVKRKTDKVLKASR